MRVAFLCGCQPIDQTTQEHDDDDDDDGKEEREQKEPIPLLFCTNAAHEAAWCQLGHLVWWLQVVQLLESENGRIASELAQIWVRVLVQGGVPVPQQSKVNSSSNNSAPPKANKPLKDQVMRAFEYLLNQWLWSDRNDAPTRRLIVQLVCHGFLGYIDTITAIVERLLALNHAKAATHLPHFANTLEMCAGNVFQWLLTNTGMQNAHFAPLQSPPSSLSAQPAQESAKETNDRMDLTDVIEPGQVKEEEEEEEVEAGEVEVEAKAPVAVHAPVIMSDPVPSVPDTEVMNDVIEEAVDAPLPSLSPKRTHVAPIQVVPVPAPVPIPIVTAEVAQRIFAATRHLRKAQKDDPALAMAMNQK
jgi:hypothetical protein